jgi:hypothetical protein
MLACIVGNMLTGIINLAMFSTFEPSQQEKTAYRTLLFKETIHSLRLHAAKALQCACRLLKLHRELVQKYKQAKDLKPLKITRRPRQWKCIPLLKLRVKLISFADDQVILSRKDYLTKLGIYLALKYHLKEVSKRRHYGLLSDSPGMVVKSIWEREMQDVGSKLNYVCNFNRILRFSSAVHSSVSTLSKAQSLLKLTEYINSRVKLRSKPQASDVNLILNHPRRLKGHNLLHTSFQEKSIETTEPSARGILELRQLEEEDVVESAYVRWASSFKLQA